MTSPYAFYQFWMGAGDREVGRFLGFLSFRSPAEIEELEREAAERPAGRAAQRALAEELTTLVHGRAESARVEHAIVVSETAAAQLRRVRARGARQPGVVRGAVLDSLDESTLAAAQAETPGGVAEEPLPSVADLFVRAGLTKSKSAARRAIQEGGAYLNNHKVTDHAAVPERDELLHGRYLVLRRGKRTIAGVRVEDRR